MNCRIVCCSTVLSVYTHTLFSTKKTDLWRWVQAHLTTSKTSNNIFVLITGICPGRKPSNGIPFIPLHGVEDVSEINISLFRNKSTWQETCAAVFCLYVRITAAWYILCVLVFYSWRKRHHSVVSVPPKDTGQLDPRCFFVIEVLQGWGFTCMTSLSGPRECKEKHLRIWAVSSNYTRTNGCIGQKSNCVGLPNKKGKRDNKRSFLRGLSFS